jgi:deoxyribose-phosphate aldolase
MQDLLENLNRRFDYAALKSDTAKKAVLTLCNEAIENNFFAVAVNPVWVKIASEKLKGTNTKVVSTAGFPLGANRTDVKASEAAKAVNDGATEIDMVANIGWIKSGNFKAVEKEIAEIRKSIPFNIILKVIIEASLLAESEQIEATNAVVAGGAQFVKTGTGFFGSATVEQVQTLFKAANDMIEVKASGGIRTVEQCRKLLEIGAVRLGSSSCVYIMKELKASKQALSG